MTDKEIEQMAKDMFSEESAFDIFELELAIKAMKVVRDKYEQKIQLMNSKSFK